MREEALLEIKPDALDRVAVGRVGGSGTSGTLAGTASAFEPCQPA